MSTETIDASQTDELHNESNEALCRICHMTQQDDPSRILYHPCKCKGSIRLIHADCCLTWLEVKQQSRCEICDWPIQIEARFHSTASDTPTWIDAAIVLVQFIYRLFGDILEQYSFGTLLRLAVLVVLLKLTSDTSQPISLSISETFQDFGFSQFIVLLINLSRITAITLTASWILVFVLLLILVQLSIIHNRLIHIFCVRLQAKVMKGGFTHQCKRSINEIVEHALTICHMVMDFDNLPTLVTLTNQLHAPLVCIVIIIPHAIVRTSFFVLQFIIPEHNSCRYIIDALHPSNMAYLLLQTLVALYNGGLVALLPATYAESTRASFSQALPSSFIVISPDQLRSLAQTLHISWWMSSCQFGCFILLCLCTLPRSTLRSNGMLFVLRTSVFAAIKVSIWIFNHMITVPVLLGACLHICVGVPAFAMEFKDFVVLYASRPYTCFSLYLIFGTISCFSLTTFLRATVLDIAAKRVVSRVFFDSSYDPYVQSLRSSLRTCIYLCVRSVLLYSAMMSLVVYLPLSLVVFWCHLFSHFTGVSVLRNTLLVMELPHELHVLLTGTAILLRIMIRSNWSLPCLSIQGDLQWLRRISAFVADKFGIRHWWMKDEAERFQEKEAGRQLREERLELLQEFGVGVADNADLDDDWDDDLFPVDRSELAVLVDEPASDDEWFESGVQEFDDETELDDLLAEIQSELFDSRDHLAQSRASAAKDAEREREERGAVKHFKLRLIGFLTMYIGILGGIVTIRFAVSLVVGRVLLRLVPFFVSLRHNDLISFVVGSLLTCHLGSCISSIPRLARGVRTTWLALLKGSLLVFYFTLCFPFALGLLISHFGVLPIRVAIFQQPVFYPEHIFLIGIASLSLPLVTNVLRQLFFHEVQDHAQDQGNPWTRWLNSLIDINSRGLRRSRLVMIVYDTVLPSAEALVHTLALPYFFCKVMLPLRELLPMFLRVDEFLLMRLMRDSPHDDSDDLVISRAIEEGVYRYSFITLAICRIVLAVIELSQAWYEKFCHNAWRVRFSHQVLVNVPNSPIIQEDEAESSDSDHSNHSDTSDSNNSETESDDVVRFRNGRQNADIERNEDFGAIT